MSRMIGGATRALDALVGALLLVIVAVTVAQVVARYGLGASLVWSEELNRLLYLWLVMLAAVRAAHMRIRLVVDRLPTGPRRVLVALDAAISLAVLALLVYGGQAMMRLTAYDMFTGIAVSVKWMFVAVIVGGALWALAQLARSVRELRSREAGRGGTSS